jgi:hypothetical protein
MNALEAKARQERFAALVAGDPIGHHSFPACALDTVLQGRQSVGLDDVAQALGNLDRNRVEHHLIARGYVPTDFDATVYERRPWYLHPWPAVENSTSGAELQKPGEKDPEATPPMTFGSSRSGGGGKLASTRTGGGSPLSSSRK